VFYGTASAKQAMPTAPAQRSAPRGLFSDRAASATCDVTAVMFGIERIGAAGAGIHRAVGFQPDARRIPVCTESIASRFPVTRRYNRKANQTAAMHNIAAIR
jgi:hypothetical protein